MPYFLSVQMHQMKWREDKDEVKWREDEDEFYLRSEDEEEDVDCYGLFELYIRFK